MKHDAWLAEQEDTFLACRDLRHNWTLKGNKVFQASRYSFYRSLSCTRCKTKKEQLIVNGMVRSTRMIYPEGYLKAPEVQAGRVKRTVVLQESLRRATAVQDLPGNVIDFFEKRNIRITGAGNQKKK